MYESITEYTSTFHASTHFDSFSNHCPYRVTTTPLQAVYYQDIECWLY